MVRWNLRPGPAAWSKVYILCERISDGAEKGDLYIAACLQQFNKVLGLAFVYTSRQTCCRSWL